MASTSRNSQTGRQSQFSRHQHHQLPQKRRQLEFAEQTAAYASPCTTSLYHRRGDEISLDEMERISY
jgi:hypothetical protein